MNRRELEHFAGKTWPVMGFTVQRLFAFSEADRERLNASDLANAVLHDPLLVFQLMRAVGQVERGRKLSDTLCVEHALMLIGVDPFFASFGQMPSIDTHPGMVARRKRTVAALLARARMAALLVKDWLSMIDEYRVEEYFTAALLYNVPLAFYAIDNDVELEGDVERAALRALGEQYPLFVRDILGATGMPGKILDLLLGQDLELSRQRLLLRHAIHTANHLAAGWWTQEVQSHLRAVSGLVTQPEDTIWRSVINAALSLARVPYTRAYADPARVLPLIAEAPLVSENDFLELDWQSDDGGEVARYNLALSQAVRRVASTAGVDRVMFFQLDAGNGQLVSRYHIGVDVGDALVQQSIDPLAPGFFATFTTKPQAFRASAGQVPLLMERYPHPLWPLLAPQGFVLVSVFRQGRLAGVMLVDNQTRGAGVDDQAYARVKAAVAALPL
ncbi:MAG: hypothetical protein KBE25_06695 [Laribacter sp.]|nr:hypothetical protein [Laribacter sp.]